MPDGDLHSWAVTPREAVVLQRELRARLVECPLPARASLVAGSDISYSRRDNLLFAAVIVLRLPGLETVDQATVVQEATWPYVPGLLTFREAPALIEAFRRLTIRPQVLMVDGHGLSHPRGMGIASHLGLWLDLPTVGCAKSRLCGVDCAPGPRRGNRCALKLDGRVIGAVLRTKDNVNPIYVSAGHRADLPGAIRLVLRCGAGYRIPEPTRRSHILVNRLRAEHNLKH